jgi:hypothetical protein
MNLPRRRFLHLAAGAATTTALAPLAIPFPAQGHPSKQQPYPSVLPVTGWRRPSRGLPTRTAKARAPASPSTPILRVRPPMLPMHARVLVCRLDLSMARS